MAHNPKSTTRLVGHYSRLAVARLGRSPRLAVSPAGETSLRLGPVNKNNTQVLFLNQVRPLGFEPRTLEV